ncbi:hypothetical protein OF829_16395 [Sphingomonas sp. LB-2]|uniref:hypothetical protein n=1 Tax=Sphingomonas caeni TaxID=2984949 RepID=UPI00222F307F|nr:hypothetical protein [Sphingomonas caeni]MCW3848819.1 hypothetical protein [Sphingomonas caeni]
MIRYLLPIAAAVMAAAPAHAADLATIGCIADKIELPVRAQIAIDVERNLTETGKRHSYDPRVTAALNLAGKMCADANGWPEAAVKPAKLYALATLGWPVAQKIATERGFDTGALEDMWQSLPEEMRNQPLPQPEYETLVKGFVTDEKQQTRENAELIAECFGFLSIIQYSSYEFSQA